MDIPEQHTVVFRKSANQQALLLGCDPIMLGLLTLLCVVIGYSFMTLWGVGIAVVLFFGGRFVLAAIGEYDPKFFRIWFEVGRYRQGFWPAKPLLKPRWRISTCLPKYALS